MTKIKKLNKKFTENDWNHMHDCILDITFHTTKKNCSRCELINIFLKLPSKLKHEAYDFGMSDTLWRDKFSLWYLDNIEKLSNRTEIEICKENFDNLKEFINKKLDFLTEEELKERKIFIEFLAKKYSEE
jgi:hypothetical protein